MDVGKVLQDARVAKNLTLDRAAQETNIRKAYLEAIEQNDFAALQGDVFVKGVMRTYGNYLGLDGAQLVEEYKAAIPLNPTGISVPATAMITGCCLLLQAYLPWRWLLQAGFIIT